MRGATESGELAKELIADADAVARHQVQPGQLSVHADRGSSMTSNPVVELLAFLGISRSHSRPHVSNDNPFNESQFKTLKYCWRPRPTQPSSARPLAITSADQISNHSRSQKTLFTRSLCIARSKTWDTTSVRLRQSNEHCTRAVGTANCS